MNTLSGDTSLFAEVDGKYGVYTLRELFEIHGKGHRIKVPALFDEHGNIGWVEVEDIVNFGKKPLKRITFATTRLYIEVSEDIIIPTFSHRLFSGTEEQIKMNFKRVNEIKVTENSWNNVSILLTTKIFLNIPEGDQKEWDYGFALGFYLSEGNLDFRKRKNTNSSLAVLKGLAKKKGLSLEEYLEYMTEARRVKIAVGKNDFERGYVAILQKLFKMSKPSKKKNENSYYLYFPDLNFVRLTKFYSVGFNSHTKHLKNEVYNRSLKFIEGILDGYLSGDGYCNHGKGCNSFFVNMTTNYQLYNDLIFLAKVVGYDAHIIKGRFSKSPSGKIFYQLRLSIFKNYRRRIAFGLVKERIKKIDDVGEREAFNLILKPLHFENDRRAIFNHLFFTAYGFLVSDAVKTLDRRVLSSSLLVPVSSKGLKKDVVLNNMKRVDVYVSDEQYEKWRQKAESEGMSVSSFVKKAVESALSNGFVEKKNETIAKLEERVSDLEHELDLVMFALDKVDNALKKMNRGEKLELNDFVYSSDDGK